MDRLRRFWIWLTQPSELPYGRWLLVVGSLDVLAGLFFRFLGHPGNQGLPIAAAGVFVIAVGIATTFLRRA